MADAAIRSIGELTRIISGISVSLARTPEEAIEAKETVVAVKGSFELARRRLEGTGPPPGYEEFHRTLLEALGLYAQASAALLPDSETGRPDVSLFQELMLNGGKNAHIAFAEFEELTRPAR